MSSSTYTSLIATGGTLTITTPYSVTTNLKFENEGTAAGVIIFSRTALGVETSTVDGTVSASAYFGGTVLNMLPGAYAGIQGNQVTIQAVQSLFNALDVASTASVDNADFAGHVTFAALSGNQILVVDGTVQMSVETPFTLDANEKLIIDEMATALFGTAANTATLDIAFAMRTNPNSNNPFIDAVFTTASPVNPCFAAGTRILTARGEVPVEALNVGDLVIRPDGGEAPIVWIGKRELDLSAALRPEAVRPVIVEAGALADGMPARALRLSPDHALFLEGVLVPVKELINWNSIRQDHRAASVTYYHVELPRHGALFAEAVPVESFLDTGHRGVFDHETEQVVALPAAMQARREAESFAPLCVAGPILEALRQRIAERQTGIRLSAG